MASQKHDTTVDEPQVDPVNEAARTASAAVAEVQAENDPDTVVEFEHLGQRYSFKRKRLNALQFLGPMQRNHDTIAIEWLIGPEQYRRFLISAADEDGCTSRTAFSDFLSAISEAVRVPNS
jgi:hypothetical protein